MRKVTEHEYTTYPKRFEGYRWYKPLIVGVLFSVFSFISGAFLVGLITKAIFGITVSSSGYDTMDFFTAPGAFQNGLEAACVMPCLLLAAIIVKDRPVSSYFSSMGGWRWNVFLKTIAASFVFLGIPTIVWQLLKGKTGDITFTIGGFIILTLVVPFQALAEELTCRSYIMQTVSSWFKLPVAGLIAQIVVFTAAHPYNIIGRVEIAVSALLYALVCILTKGLEAPTALHISNNLFEIYMAGIGYGSITAEQTIPDIVFNISFKILFFLFILFADKKLNWFDKVKSDDVARFNAKRG